MSTSTETETNTVALTADDVAALRTADSVSLVHHDGRGYLRAFLDSGHADEPRIFTASEQRLFPDTNVMAHGRAREIAVRTYMFGYDGDGGIGIAWSLETEPQAAAYEYISSGQYDPVWCTAVSLMRAGDTLRLNWVADNNTEIVRKAGMHADEVTLVIERPGKPKPRQMHLLIRCAVRHDNSARMIRRHG